jgi:CheY-like chemotaxis protein
MSNERRILCVDDEEGVLKALKRLFFEEDCDVRTATSGEEGIRILESTPDIQVIISDYRMPGMNGVLFLRAVSARWPETVRILLSGYSELKAVIEAVNEGRIYRFVSKPWNDDELKIAVTNAMERWRLARRNEDLAKQLQKANEDLLALNTILQERITDEVTALRERNRNLEEAGAVLDALPQAIACLDGDGWITYYNRAANELFSWGNTNMKYVPRTKAFPGNLNDLIVSSMNNGGASAPLEINGKTVLARSGRTTEHGKPGVILMFGEYSAEAARRTA